MCMCVGMMLDPRFRNSSRSLPFLGGPVSGIQLWNRDKQRLMCRVPKGIQIDSDIVLDSGIVLDGGPSQVAPPPVQNRPSMFSALYSVERELRQRQFARVGEIGEQVEQEVDSYLRGEAIPPHNMDSSPTNILQWWKANAYKWPNVAKVARSILAIPASSVPSERVFSKAGELLTTKRLGMKPKQVDLLLFLNQNKEYINTLQITAEKRS